MLLLSLHRHIPAVVSCSAELNTLSSLLARLLAAPTPSWLAWPVFVIVALAPGQAWLGASLVGTVCTVSAEPSLSSYTINFFFSNLVGVGWRRKQGKSFSYAWEQPTLNSAEMLFMKGSLLFILLSFFYFLSSSLHFLTRGNQLVWDHQCEVLFSTTRILNLYS